MNMLNQIYSPNIINIFSNNGWKEGFALNSFKKKAKEKMYHVDFEAQFSKSNDFKLIHYSVDELNLKTNKNKTVYFKDFKELENYISNI